MEFSVHQTAKTKDKTASREKKSVMFIIDKELLFKIWKGLLWYKEEKRDAQKTQEKLVNWFQIGKANFKKLLF